MGEQFPARRAASSAGDAGQPARRTAARYGRRAVVLGAAAAGAGLTVDLVSGAPQAQASNGNPVLLGDSNSATHATVVTSKSSDALQGSTSADLQSGVIGEDSSSGGGYGVKSSSANGFAVAGNSRNGVGVYGGTGATSVAFGISASCGLYGQDTSKGGGFGGYGTSANGTGVQGVTTAKGQSGASGIDNSTGGGHGTYGRSTNGTGAYGISTNGAGVQGTTQANGESGVSGIDNSTAGGHGTYGRSANGTGAYGRTSANGKAGVAGVDASADGGYGVQGSSTAGTGVQGSSAAGTGVQGSSAAGTGVLASSSTGTALDVVGIASFDRSGSTVVPGSVGAPQTSVTVNLITLSPASLILATPQTYLPGVAVAAVVTDPAARSFTIYLTQAVTSAFSVAWFVIG
jgi:hypothetical protein